MTKEQAHTLADFALKAMPKSNEAQQTVLRDAIEKYPEEVVADAIVAHASESEFISTPQILERVRDKLGGGNVAKMEREALERMQRARAEAELKRESLTATIDPTVTAAHAFCAGTDPDQLAAWRVKVEAENPWLAARSWHGKETLGLLPLECAIFTKFGRIPRDAWIGGAA